LHVRRYVDTSYGVEARTEDKHGNRLEQNILSGKWEKVKKQDNFSFFGSSSRTKKKSDSIWGTSNSASSLFGSSSTKKRKSKRKSDDCSIW